MKTSTAFVSASLAALAAAAPTPTINKRSTTSDCAQYGSTTVGAYTVDNDLWGEANGSGSQCVTVTGLSDSSLEWSTTWSWANNPNDVKSYSNAVYNFTKSQLSDVTSMQSTFDWSYTGDSVVADVSYDLFTSSTVDGTEEYEIMIWLAALGGAGPISASYNAAGNPVAIATTTVAGHSFSLYKGTNGVQTATYSFIASENVTSFSGDIRDFLTYLIDSESFDASQYLVSVGAGTEAFTGSDALFTVSGYSMDVVIGGAASSSAASTAVASSATAAAATSSATAAVSTSAAASSAVAPVSSSVAAAASSYAPASSSTAVAALSTGAASPSGSVPSGRPVYPSGTGRPTYPSGTGRPAFPSGTASPISTAAPEPDCEVQYVYV